MIGFSNYDVVDTPSLTTKEMVDLLTSQQRLAILNGFAAKTPENRLKYEIFIELTIIKHLYNAIDRVEEYCREIMREEVLITPEVIDPETGDITSEAAYNVAPEEIEDLKLIVNIKFSSEFSEGQSSAIVNKMVAMSKTDESGDWAYYSVEVKE